mgnify:CR=1 FL=1
MITCVCNNISDKKINHILDSRIEKNQRIESIEELQKEIPICNNCGTCFCALKGIIEKKNGYEIKEPELESLFDSM